MGSTLLLLGGFLLLVAAVGVALSGIGRLGPLRSTLQKLQDSSSQIRVRDAFLLLVGFAVLAQFLGLEVILGAFIAGAVLRLIDCHGAMTHSQFRAKLEAVGFGVFIPFFFVTSGMGLDVRAVFGSGAAALAPAPVFLPALLLVRGLPAASTAPRSAPGAQWRRGSCRLPRYRSSSRPRISGSSWGKTLNGWREPGIVSHLPRPEV